MSICLKFHTIMMLFLLCIPQAHAKRKAPVDIPPITINGDTFIQSKDVCGLVLQQHEDIDNIVTKITFYEVTYDANLEKDVQDVWFTDFFHVDEVIWVRDERGRIYKMSLKTMHPEKLDNMTDLEFEALKALRE